VGRFRPPRRRSFIHGPLLRRIVRSRLSPPAGTGQLACQPAGPGLSLDASTYSRAGGRPREGKQVVLPSWKGGITAGLRG